jgi:hypothetical protein
MIPLVDLSPLLGSLARSSQLSRESHPLIKSPFCSPYAAHRHPHPPHNPDPTTAPGALDPDAPGPADALPVEQINEMYMAKNQMISDRLEAEGRGYDSIFAQ